MSKSQSQPVPVLSDSVSEIKEQIEGKLGRLPDATVVSRRRLILREYSKGHTVEQLSLMFGMRQEAVEREIAQAYSLLTHYFSSPKPHHTFVRYAAFQFNIIKKLQDAYESIMKSSATSTTGGRQTTAAIQALRAQSDIMDKVVDKGIEFGVIQRKVPDDLASLLRMTSGDLKIELRSEIKQLTLLLDKVDDEQVTIYRATQKHNADGYRIIRKPLMNSMGVIQFGHDWKRKTAFYDSAGKKLPQEYLTPQQIEFLENKSQLAKLETIAKETSIVIHKQKQEINSPDMTLNEIEEY